MGLFLAASAFRNRSAADVADTIRAYASKFGSAAEPCGPSDPETPEDVHVYAPAQGWTVVRWPAFFNVHDVPFCLDGSHNLRTLVSTVHIYDGDYWAHFLMENGALLDRFASWPDYFDPELPDAARAQWKGNPELIASKAGCDPTAIRPYLVHPDPEDPPPGKAAEDDAFELADVRVFADLWRRMGIRWDTAAASALRMQLDRKYGTHLPVSKEEL
ncbi:MAG: hypothetical protein HY898_28395 [Deltaproteobacteria bacterium]|nr:hypothetical protein [Deltaproteobacteria bacterium]